MPVADLLIAIVILISIVVGALRGFVKEAISVVTLVVAIWAALRFAPMGGSLIGSRKGDVVEAKLPKGVRKLEIVSIALYD